MAFVPMETTAQIAASLKVNDSGGATATLSNNDSFATTTSTSTSSSIHNTSSPSSSGSPQRLHLLPTTETTTTTTSTAHLSPHSPSTLQVGSAFAAGAHHHHHPPVMGIISPPSPGEKLEIHERINPCAPPPVSLEPVSAPRSLFTTSDSLATALQIEETPNPNARLFYLPQGVKFDIADGAKLPARYERDGPREGAPLAVRLLSMDGVTEVCIGGTFCNVTTDGTKPWTQMLAPLKIEIARLVLEETPAIEFVVQSRGAVEESDSDEPPPWADSDDE